MGRANFEKGRGGAGGGLGCYFWGEVVGIKLSCCPSLGVDPKQAYFCFFVMKEVELVYSLWRNW